jgi:hypothetical protein
MSWPTASSLRPRPPQLTFGFGGVGADGLHPFVAVPGALDVDLVGKFGVLGEDGHEIVVHRQESPVHRDAENLPVRFEDPGGETLAQLRQHRRVPRHDADVAVDRAGDHHLGRS